MKTLYRAYCFAEEVVCGILFFSIVALIFSSAVLRLFNRPLIWADDIAKLCFAWVAFLGADAAMRRCRLVGVDIVMNALKPKLRKALYIVGTLVIMATLVLFMYYGYRGYVRAFDRYFQTLPISYSYIALSLPVGSLCMMLTCAIKLCKLILNFNDDSYSLKDDTGDTAVAVGEGTVF